MSTEPGGADASCLQCHGLGYRVHPSGEFALAEACNCVGRCTACGGRRYRFEKNGRGYVEARPCPCGFVEARVEMFNRAGVPSRFSDAALEAGHESDKARRELKYELLQYRDTFEPGQPGYLFSGSPGTGKTYLVAALVSHFALERGIRCKFIDFGHLTTIIKQGYSAGKAENEIIDGLVNIPVLAVDELGKGRGSEWEITVLDALVNRRYNAGASTFFTTNYVVRAGSDPAAAAPVSPLGSTGPNALQAVISRSWGKGGLGGDQLDKLRTHPSLQTLEDRVGSRIHSRLFEMCRIRQVQGEDIRQSQLSAR